MKTKLLLIILFVSLINFYGFSQNGKPTKVGEEIYKSIESNHPYNGSKTKNIELVPTLRIFEKNASYIAVHFEKFDIKKGDYLIVRNPDNTRSWKYSLNTQHKKRFWSIHIYGQEVIIEIYSKNKKGGYGYKIDKIAKGYQFNPATRNYSPEALCEADDSKEAKCYQSSEPFIYEKSKAVARLLINGTNACTGWLIGDDGHLMTNEHCVANATVADNVTVEFMAEGSSCSNDCRSWFGCGGTIEATSTSLIRVNSNLDYALLQLPNNVSSKYGFLQLRKDGAIQGERIYIPQHPRAWGKRIAVESTNTNDSGGFARIYSLNESRCGGSGNDIGYYADTQGGSSGSPVLGYNDNLVVALHHCGSCPNRGVPVQEIINDLGNYLPNNSISNETTIGNITTLCYTNPKTINLNNNQNNSVTWLSSTNVQILSSNDNSITVKARTYNSNGNGWVKATLSNGVTLQEDFWVGKPTINTIFDEIEINGENSNIFKPLCKTYFYNEKNKRKITVNGDFNKIEYRKLNGTFEYTSSYGTIWFQPHKTGSISIEVRAKNSCGWTNWEVFIFLLKIVLTIMIIFLYTLILLTAI